MSNSEQVVELSKEFYDPQAIEDAIGEFKDQGEVSMEEQAKKTIVKFRSMNQNIHLDFANYLLSVKQKK